MKHLFLITILFCMIVFFSSSLHAALIMKSDGESMICQFENESAGFTVKIGDGNMAAQKHIKFKDIIWMAGANKKRIRIAGQKEIIIGTVEDNNIAIRRNNELLTFTPDNIIFFYHKNINLDEYGTLIIKESQDRTVMYRSYRAYSSIPIGYRLRIELLTSFWDGHIVISNPKYKRIIKSQSDFEIAIDIQANDIWYSYMMSNAKNLELITEYEAEGKDFHSTIFTYKGILDMNGSLPTSSGKKGTLWNNYENLFYQKNNFGIQEREIYGKGYLNLYFCLKDNVSRDCAESLADGRLKITKTVSNVLKLPISIIKHGEKALRGISMEDVTSLSNNIIKVHLYAMTFDDKSEAENMLSKLKKGESFIQLAKERSKDQKNENSYDFGEVYLSDIKKDLQAALKSIKQGQFTEVIESDYKYRIYYLKSISTPHVETE